MSELAGIPLLPFLAPWLGGGEQNTAQHPGKRGSQGGQQLDWCLLNRAQRCITVGWISYGSPLSPSCVVPAFIKKFFLRSERESHQSGGGMVTWMCFVANHILLRNLTDPSRGGNPSHPLFPTWKAPFLCLSWSSWGAEVTPAAMLSPTRHWESSMSHAGKQSLSISQGLKAAGGVAGVILPPAPRMHHHTFAHGLSFAMRTGPPEVPGGEFPKEGTSSTPC